MLGYFTIDTGIGGADRLLAETAQTLMQQGLRLAGAVQSNIDRGPGRDCDMDLRILGDDGPEIRISQSLGDCSEGCRLDTEALTRAVGRAGTVLERGADLVIVNKFGKQECHGRGFRDFIASALERGIPVVLSVPVEQVGDFRAFAGELAEPVAPDALLDWCRQRTGLTA